MYNNLLSIGLLLLPSITLSSSGRWETIPSDCEAEYMYIDECFAYGDPNADTYDVFEFLRYQCAMAGGGLASIKTAQIQNEIFALIDQQCPEDGVSMKGGIECVNKECYFDDSCGTTTFAPGDRQCFVGFGGIFTFKEETDSPPLPTDYSKMFYEVEWDNHDPFTPHSLAFAPDQPNDNEYLEPGIIMEILTGLVWDVQIGGFDADNHPNGLGVGIVCQRPLVNTCNAGKDSTCLDGKSCAPPERVETRGDAIIDVMGNVGNPSKCANFCLYNKYCQSWSWVKSTAISYGHALNGLHLWAKDCVLYNTKCYITDDPALQSGFLIKPQNDYQPQPDPYRPAPDPYYPQPDPYYPQPDPYRPEPDPYNPQPDPYYPQPEPYQPQPDYGNDGYGDSGYVDDGYDASPEYNEQRLARRRERRQARASGRK